MTREGSSGEKSVGQGDTRGLFKWKKVSDGVTREGSAGEKSVWRGTNEALIVRLQKNLINSYCFYKTQTQVLVFLDLTVNQAYTLIAPSFTVECAGWTHVLQVCSHNYILLLKMIFYPDINPNLGVIIIVYHTVEGKTLEVVGNS